MSSFYEDASLVMIPSGYKTSKVYSAKPTDGTGDLTFTRSNDTATRVASNGLIEKVRTNLCLQSQTIDNATSWSNTLDTGATLTVTANHAAAPDGTTTAERIQMALNGSAYAQRNQAITLAAGGEFTYSVYLKSLSGTPTIIFFYDNVNNKTATLTNDWVRYTWTFTSTGNVLPRFVLEAGTSSSADFLAWGCQLETGVATDYIATTSAAVSVGPVANVPRLDYLGSSCPRLLLEPQRTNLAFYSEQLNNAVWPTAGCSITANALISPDGTLNADYIVENSAASTQHRIQTTLLGGTNAIHTVSVFVKQGVGSRNAYIDLGSFYCYYNFSTGVITAINGTASVQDYGSGWYRIIITSTAALTPATFYIGLADGTSETYSGDGTSSIAFWGAQVEAGAYATSYIPTLGSASTRGVDAMSKSSYACGITTEATLFADFEYQKTDTGYSTQFLIYNVSAGDYIYLTVVNNSIRAICVSAGVLQSNIILGSTTAGTRYKAAARFKQNDFALYVNGTLVGTDTSGTMPTFSTAGVTSYIGNDAGTSEPAGYANQYIAFPTALSNDSLAALTA
jgi:hypothetical protein